MLASVLQGPRVACFGVSCVSADIQGERAQTANKSTKITKSCEQPAAALESKAEEAGRWPEKELREQEERGRSQQAEYIHSRVAARTATLASTNSDHTAGHCCAAAVTIMR